MSDFYLSEIGNGIYDIEFENGDIKMDKGLASCLLMSILSNRRADASLVKARELRGGWLGNETRATGVEQGSLFWLSIYSSLDSNTKKNVTNYIQESLQWLVDDNIAKSVEVVVNIVQDSITCDITLTQPDNITQSYNFILWSNTNAR